MQIVAYADREPHRFKRGQGWKVNLFGQNSDIPAKDLQAFRIDMSANMVLDAHLHIVDQFQIFIAGSGRIGRDRADMITAHYADHHTAYGPLVADAHGMSYLTLRPKTDAGLIKVSTPNIRSHLQPTKRRHRVSTRVVLSIPPVLEHLAAPVVETIMEEKPGDDGMTTQVYRLGKRQSLPCPATQGTGGYYIIIMNGTCPWDGVELGPWSLVFVEPDDAPPHLHAGDQGLEAMIAIFPRRDGWMDQLGEA